MGLSFHKHFGQGGSNHSGKDWPSGVEGGEETDHVLGTSSLIPDSRAELFLYGLAYESARPGVKGMLLAPKDRSVEVCSRPRDGESNHFLSLLY